jgi:ABC-type glycerol-3-phosphate transport system substrate-binding protein
MRALLALLLVAAGVSGCGGESMAAPTSTPTQTSAVNFTSFTEKLLQIHSDSAQPTAVTNAQFEFPDNDNPQAFAAVLPAV